MLKNKQSDLELHITKSPPGRSAGRGSLVMDFIIAALLFLALFGAVTAAMPASSASLLAPALAGAAACALMVFPSRASWGRYIFPALLAALLLTTLILRVNVTEGLCLLWNRWCAALTTATGRLHLGRTVNGAGTEASLRLFLLAAAVLLAICAVGMRNACPHLAAVLCLLLALGLALLPELNESGVRVALLLTAGLALLLTQGRQTDGGAMQRLLPLLFACAVFALLLLTARSMTPVRDGTCFAALRQRADAAVHTARYEPEPQPLPEGDLTSVGQKPDGGTARLQLTMTKPETLYLRGFVGDEFTGDAWKSLSNAALAEEADLLYWLHRSGFYPQTQASYAGSLADGAVEFNDISVKNQAACSRYIYAPYSLSRNDGHFWLSVTDLNASTIRAPERKGLRQYRYATVYKAPDASDTWIEPLERGGNPEIDAYRSEEAGYREFVDAHDLALPESVRSLFDPLLTELSEEYGGLEAVTPDQAVECVERFLEQNLTYRADVPAMDAGDDFAAYTLNTLRGGYDVHYATLTVLALRWFGIPARYAEGYLVTEAQAAKAAGTWITLDDGNACAWAEVYEDGIGWLPLKQTPGYTAAAGESEAGDNPLPVSSEPDETSPVGTTIRENETSEPADSAAGAVSENMQDADHTETPDTETPEQEQTVLPNETEAQLPDQSHRPQTALPKQHNLLWLLPVLLVLLLLAGLLLRRRYILNRRERLFAQDDPAQAVSCVFAYLLELLEPLAIRAQKGRLLELPPLVAEKLEPDYAERFAKMTELNYRALFCSRPLPEGAWEEISAFRRETLERLRQGCGFWKRLRLKWLQCLY